MSRRALGLVLIVLGVLGLVGSGWALAVRWNDHWGRPSRLISYGGGYRSACTPPELPGQPVDVILSDMGGGMMSGGRMMSVAANPSTISAGDVSFRVWNEGMMVHELVVMPLPAGGAGSRPIGSDGRVSEAGSLGEASRSCGEGAGDGIAPGSVGWVTMDLAPGRYELICNLPGHYARGMFTELDVG